MNTSLRGCAGASPVQVYVKQGFPWLQEWR